jgi:glutathione synthase/RimK-type ligase-like ATP-grasp enzyme
VILFLGIPSEPPIALAIRAAAARGLDHLVLNQREFPFCDIRLQMRDGQLSGELWALERAWPLASFSGVYTRAIDDRDLPENRPRRTETGAGDRVHKTAFVHETLTAWLELAPCRVVNRLRPCATNGSKPYQAQRIRRAGFLVPPTLITNDPADVREFRRLHRRLIYKSTSSVRSIVQELAAPAMNDLDRIRDLPTQFQARIEGTDVRVHVVGASIFATRILCDAIDYRYASQDGLDIVMEPFDLPPSVAARCLALSHELELPFCGIDLRVTPDGQYYCFEVNPSPAYSYYQEIGGQPIADALVAFLAGAAAS